MGSNQDIFYGARKGSAQQDRRLEAASPDSIPLDERGLGEWVDFARRFSSWIRFPDREIQGDQSWARFFERDITALYARLALESEPLFRRELHGRWQKLASPDPDYTLAERRQAFSELFGGLASLAGAINQYAASLPRHSPLRPLMEQGVEDRLAPALRRAMGYYKAARQSDWIKEPLSTEWKILDQPVQAFSYWMDQESWAPVWYAPRESMSALYQDVEADHRIFLGETDPLEQGRAAMQHHLFLDVFDLFRGGWAQWTKEAEKQMLHSLESSADHLPHYALFLSFLRLTRHQKALLNQLGQDHLDFYYKDVLRMKARPARPHRAHLIIQLARHHRLHELKAGTAFFGGKEEGGRERWFQALDSEWISAAALGRVCSLYKGQEEDQTEAKKQKGRWFASPQADAADGIGEALPEEDPSWHPLGNKTYKEGAVDAIRMPLARLGFALGSRHLYLAEGKRQILLRAVLAMNPEELPLDSRWDLRVSTAKGWLELPQPQLIKGTTSVESGARPCLEFRIDISSSAPAIEANPDLGYGDLPVLECCLSHGDESTPYDYGLLEGVRLQGLELEVSSGWQNAGFNQDGIKQLVLLNDGGSLDPTKPFLPFGPRPGKGARFIVGSPEIFQKSGTRLRLFIEWDQHPGSASDIVYDGFDLPEVDIDFLAGGQWVEGAHPYRSLPLFHGGSERRTLTEGQGIRIPEESIQSDPQDLRRFKASQNRGFLRLRLRSGFGQEAYESALRSFLIGLANGTKDESDEPQAPYLPSIRSLYLGYQSRLWIDAEAPPSEKEEEVQFFHLLPFGKQRLSLRSDRDQVDGGLIPALGEVEEGHYVPHEAAFYLQVVGAEAGESLSVLFQFQQGSSDPRLPKPDHHLLWSYLSGHRWKPFSREQVVDLTQEGLRSGRIRFTLPLDAGGEQTQMPGQGIWIRAAVRQSPMAVCRILGIHFQAVEVEEIREGEGAPFPSDLLAAGTIQRLRLPEAAIKKVEQPYPGYGGRAPESPKDYQLRVSERLRHKDRAITLWDYERLVLQAFPEIYRVHCLPHTRYEDDIFEENRPGHVTIIPLPDLRGRRDIHPLRPYTHQDTLEEIREFLSRRISPHVRLHVRQPRFEEVRLSMKLRFRPGLPFGLYREKLREEVGAFLTPWLGEGNPSPLRLGGQVDKAVLIRFIDQRPYVDYVTELRLHHKVEESSAIESEDQDQVRASSSRSILVSAPYGKHEIEEAEEGDSEIEPGSCLPEPEKKL